jgi:hypothetical protein
MRWGKKTFRQPPPPVAQKPPILVHRLPRVRYLNLTQRPTIPGYLHYWELTVFRVRS